MVAFTEQAGKAAPTNLFMLKVLLLPTDVLEAAAFPSSAVSLTARSQQKGRKIYSTSMPKQKARLLLCPKSNPAGAELLSNFPWLESFETATKKQS